MRKRTVKNIAETIFWYTLYMLPLIVFFIELIALWQNEALWTSWGSSATSNLNSYTVNVFYQIMREFCSNNIIATAFQNIFSEGSSMAFLGSQTGWAVTFYLSYFVLMYVVHLMVDFVLFIPKLAHKFMNSFTRGDD